MTRNQIIVAAVFLVIFLVYNNRDEKNPSQAFGAKVSANLNSTKQQWFDHFHPIGTARNIVLHSANDVKTPTGRQVNARFTIYWDGPLTTNGFTKVQAVYDYESGRWIRPQILETNGVTNAQAAEGVGEFIGGALSEMLRE